MTGKEARQILADNKINLAWLAGQMGISPQTLNSRLHAQEFKIMYVMHITSILHKDIFGIGYDELKTKQPIIDLRADIDNSKGLHHCNVLEYVSIPSLANCYGIQIYGDAMSPFLRPGDVAFVREIFDHSQIEYGRAYLVMTSNDRMMRQIYQSGRADHIQLSAFNSSQKSDGSPIYPAIDLPMLAVIHLYKVVAILTREQ